MTRRLEEAVHHEYRHDGSCKRMSALKIIARLREEMVQAMERALDDLEELGYVGGGPLLRMPIPQLLQPRPGRARPDYLESAAGPRTT